MVSQETDMTDKYETPDLNAIARRRYRALVESAIQRRHEFLESRAGIALVLAVFFPNDPLPWELETWEGEGGR
jgi:hypothetical protein